MHHDFLDKYSHLNSRVHSIDPRVKIIGFFSFIFFVIFTSPTEFQKFYFYFLLMFSIIVISKVPLAFIFKRSLVVIPFVLLVAIFIPFLKEGEVMGSYSFGSLEFAITYQGILIFFNVLIKSWLSVLSMITLVSTTPFPQLLKGFERLKIPKVMVMIISFMYRYLFILADEIMGLKTARDARAAGNHGRLWHIKTIGDIIGTLFIRSYERGERVYAAMLSRGFDGRIKTLDDFNIKRFDVFFLVLTFLILILIF
ncbi:MAG: cobalt ECF transporter T component CbiQ [Candidatus Altiarchaeales archaeon WOR_SM1_86-2]|nr:MAG: cobalt ECF transporter T component CbiQ [Candidatus Altiarchaeales archaeon WOR_SM1_86-2]